MMMKKQNKLIIFFLFSWEKPRKGNSREVNGQLSMRERLMPNVVVREESVTSRKEREGEKPCSCIFMSWNVTSTWALGERCAAEQNKQILSEKWRRMLSISTLTVFSSIRRPPWTRWTHQRWSKSSGIRRFPQNTSTRRYFRAMLHCHAATASRGLRNNPSSIVL